MRPGVFPLLAPLALTACATPLSPTGDRFPQRLAALGTEPFWNLAIEGDRLRYISADEPESRVGQVSRREEGGVLVLEGRLAGRPVRAAVRRERCSDGMSDRTYPLAIEIVLDGRRLAGCAWHPARSEASR